MTLTFKNKKKYKKFTNKQAISRIEKVLARQKYKEEEVKVAGIKRKIATAEQVLLWLF